MYSTSLTHATSNGDLDSEKCYSSEIQISHSTFPLGNKGIHFCFLLCSLCFLVSSLLSGRYNERGKVGEEKKKGEKKSSILSLIFTQYKSQIGRSLLGYFTVLRRLLHSCSVMQVSEGTYPKYYLVLNKYSQVNFLLFLENIFLSRILS